MTINVINKDEILEQAKTIDADDHSYYLACSWVFDKEELEETGDTEIDVTLYLRDDGLGEDELFLTSDDMDFREILRADNCSLDYYIENQVHDVVYDAIETQINAEKKEKEMYKNYVEPTEDEDEDEEEQS